MRRFVLNCKVYGKAIYMGKQLNYYMGYSGFLKVAQQALDSGCEILKKDNAKIIRSDHISIVTSDTNRYFFYLPQAGQLEIQVRNGEESVGGYCASGIVVIEASYSIVSHQDKRISRARIFSMSGYYDEQGDWIDRPECVRKVYDRLVRKIKAITPYTEIADTIIIGASDDRRPTEWKHKEYITPELLFLKVNSGYKMGL